ncbi:MAG TPA: protein kinase [Polyangiales bacterium]|nr:protein kinase [Polyangiales bacterium]
MVRPKSGSEPPHEHAELRDDLSHSKARSDQDTWSVPDSAIIDEALPAHTREGYVLGEKYQVERVLGRGGMGVVVAARHLQLHEPVAIKFLLPEFQNTEAVGRFLREAWAATKIKSEYVVRVTDVASLPGGAPYIVMEYLDGQDLASALRQDGPMPIEQTVELVLQMCEALAEAHALGIVHRDLKPSNIVRVMRSDGLLAIKVLDFGISKITHASRHKLDHASTTSTVTMGSPIYMSPEQMRSARDVDARTDIWALGTITYEMLAGKKPFSANTLPELVIEIATEPPASLRALRREVPRRLERVILRCLEKSPAARFADVAELAKQLTEFAPARARAHAERSQRVLRHESKHADSQAPTEIVRLRARPFSKRMALGLTLLLTVAAVSSAWWFTRQSPVERGSVIQPPPVAPVHAVEPHAAPPSGAPPSAAPPSAAPESPVVREPEPSPAPSKRRRAAQPAKVEALQRLPVSPNPDSAGDEELGGRL